MANTKVSTTSYIDLNAQLNIWKTDENGNKYVNFEADKEATRQYFLQEVNPNSQHFYTLHEKLEFLFVNEYYEPEIWEQYGLVYDRESGEIAKDSGFDSVKSLYKLVYDEKHRFESLMSALKFYTQYAMKTFDKKTWLERYEDRIVANALMLGRGDMTLAKEIAEEIVSGRLQPATPTFSNAGKAQRGEYVSCFLVRTEDSMNSISRTINAALQLSKRGGGVALNLTNLRESGAPIKKISNQASGVIPVMKMLEDSFSYANQLGTRSGAGAVYLSIHHPDIQKFLDTKRENADEKIRVKTLSLGIVVTDVVFQLAKENKDLHLFSPYDVERVYGVGMADMSITENYHDMVENPNIRKKRINARELLSDIAEVQFESGYPYLMFEDTVNKANPIKGRVNMSNLCVSGDTLVLTDSGYETARNLHKWESNFKVVVDKRAKFYEDSDISDYGVSLENSTKMMMTARNAEVFEVKTAEGYSIKTTEWHKFYVHRGDKIVKIPLVDVEIGDKILVQSAESNSFGSEGNPDLAYMAGTLASDGTYGAAGTYGPAARWYLYGAKEVFKNRLEETAYRLLKDRPGLLNKHNATLTPSFNYSEKSDRWSMSSAPLTHLLQEEGITKETKLEVPNMVTGGNRETQIAYLQGVFQLDSSITGSMSNKSCSIELGSISESFLQKIQILLLNFGIYSRIYASKGPRTFVMADGREYPSQPIFSLRVSESASRIALYNLIGDWLPHHVARWDELEGGREARTKSRFHKFTATVLSIEFSGTEDVYDVTVENGHSLIFNGIATGNCTEILQVNTPSTYNEDLSYKTIGNDISCNLASLNIAKTLEGGNLDKTVTAAIKGLSAVSDLSDIQAVPSIAQGNRSSRAIGLGQMNLHGFFIKEDMAYGDEDSLDFTNIYFMAVAYYAYKASMDLARETGSTFEAFSDSKYADSSYLTEKYAVDSMVKPNKNTQAIFEKYGISLPTSKDWAELAEEIAEYGLYNAYLQAVPPTGSISYSNYSTSSIHPVVDLVETRKEGLIGRVYFPQPYVTNENFHKIQDAYAVGYEKTIDVYAQATKHVDQGLSLTLFHRDTATTRTLNKAYIRAWSKGIKTLYYSRVRQTALIGTEALECVSCSL